MHDGLRRTWIATPHIAGYSLDGKIGGLIMIYEAVCKHFGLSPEHTAADFLPEPSVPQIELSADDSDDEAILAQAVEAVYSIKADDAALRQIEAEPPEKQGAYFDALRKNYPVRREFHNTRVVLDDSDASLAGKFQGIGFNTKRRES